jgi:hypothetical protein
MLREAEVWPQDFGADLMIPTGNVALESMASRHAVSVAAVKMNP